MGALSADIALLMCARVTSRYSAAFQSNRGLHLNGNQFTSEVPECLNATFFWDWDDEVSLQHSILCTSPLARIAWMEDH